ncbi:GDL motif peptide-associated radical SAM/SPASM maturase [Ralstonia solanacearum]|uniref:GDL motif peptide-associated radical SAM/SPASM maturase n=2 Tax=Ralstonia solanacearum TaxID=305 RepID=A0AAE3NJD6_RALSL|nr:GDL motif peptide-associated radical SAM/SPASM maturase [Ralstonia solanacearum]MBB6582139.1 GDL motif peptide-associated radical SAM/SPASM maturase [Ralstonia solanacearum]MDB0522618.1 GDL motif peptide-associated radical SAM/SPASM maturase [Ralstonia solanacearum]
MSLQNPQPARYLSADDFQRYVPVHVVWEITLACDLKCLHCGSRAGRRRPDELNTEECLEVIESLARLGTREVSLIGGEAYLRKDWTQLIRAIRSHGMYCAIQTGGRNLTPKRLEQAVEAGLNGVGVSLDGLAPLHDKVRNVPGSFDRAVDTLKRARAAGLAISVNSQIGAQTMPDLPALMDTIIELGATHWQIQLTVAMGNAVDNDELLLQPYQLLELMPLLARLYKEGERRGLLMNVGNNIGYYGPYEHLWRGFGDERVHWNGCAAGQTVIALEADGTVKGCPSLATVGFAGGNVRDLSLEDIWRTSEAIHFGRLRSVDDLWGFCRTCYYADVCRGGCTWTSHSLLGKPGNNPYCHYRVLELQKQGLRERIVKEQDAAGASFAVGRFDLVTEHIADGTPVASIVRSGQVIELAWKNKGKRAPEVGRVPPQLALCRSCNGYIYPHEQTCPHCGADVEAEAHTYHQETVQRQSVMNNLERLLGLPASTLGEP